MKNNELLKFGGFVTLAMIGALPGLIMRLAGLSLGPLLDTILFGLAILAAGFMLSWGAESAEEHVSQGLVIAGLALVTVLPEYAVDIYYTFQAGQHPGSDYTGFAAANMTGSNRLLIGTAWPLLIVLFWWRSGKRAVELQWQNTTEIVFLGLASLYSFVIVLKGQIDLFDMVILIGLFGLYLWRVGVGKHPTRSESVDEEEKASSSFETDDDDDDDDEVGPAGLLTRLSKSQQWLIIGFLTVIAALIILLVAEPFAESLIAVGNEFGVNKFLLIQWIAPLAGEAPEIVIVILFTLRLRPTPALGALVSDKINQWTLLVGMIPLFYSLGAGHLAALPLDARQHEEFFLTAAQSLFAVGLLLKLRLTLLSGLILFGLFMVQFILGFVFQDDEAITIGLLTGLAWLYLVGAVGLFLWQRVNVWQFIRVGLLNKEDPTTSTNQT